MKTNRDCNHGRLARRCEICALTEEIERLKSVINEVYAHLGAAVAQSIPADDQIIMGHVRDACELAKKG